MDGDDDEPVDVSADRRACWTRRATARALTESPPGYRRA
jgi:hypothetical protein